MQSFKNLILLKVVLEAVLCRFVLYRKFFFGTVIAIVPIKILMVHT